MDKVYNWLRHNRPTALLMLAALLVLIGLLKPALLALREHNQEHTWAMRLSGGETAAVLAPELMYSDDTAEIHTYFATPADPKGVSCVLLAPSFDTVVVSPDRTSSGNGNNAVNCGWFLAPKHAGTGTYVLQLTVAGRTSVNAQRIEVVDAPFDFTHVTVILALGLTVTGLLVKRS